MLIKLCYKIIFFFSLSNASDLQNKSLMMIWKRKKIGAKSFISAKYRHKILLV